MTEGLLDKTRATLIIIDMQNDFCHEDGAAARLGQDIGPVRAVVGNVATLIEGARRAGVPRVFVRVEHDSFYDTPAWLARGRSGTTLDVDRVPVVEKGTWGADFYEGIKPRDDELVLTKYRYSAFAYTPLELALRGRGTDVLVLSGTQTNVCVMATANDALFHGFFPIMVDDCVASGSQIMHDAAVEDFRQRIGQVVGLDDVLAAWEVDPSQLASRG